jgi:DNA polymerase-1
MVASMFFALDYDKIDKATRHKAKFIDFGLNYGRGARSIAQANKIPVDEVEHLIAKYFAVMPGMQNLRTESIQGVKRNGYDETIFKRRRHLRANEVTKIFNFKSQSTAAHITNRTLVRLHRREGNLYRVTPLTVHDSITVQCHKDDVPEVAALVQSTMQEPVPEMPMPGKPEGISFLAEIKVGENWGSFDPKINPGGMKTWSS